MDANEPEAITKKRRSHILRNTRTVGPDKAIATVFGNFISVRTSGASQHEIFDLIISAADRGVLRDELIATLEEALYAYDAEEGRKRQTERTKAMAEYPKIKTELELLKQEMVSRTPCE